MDRHLIGIFFLTFLLSSCELFDGEDDGPASSPPTNTTSNNMVSLNCEDFEVDEVQLETLGLAATCENQVISITASTAEQYKKECFATEIGLTPESLTIALDFSNFKVNKTTGEESGSMGLEYSVKTSSLYNFPDISNIDCSFKLSGELESMTPENFAQFECTYDKSSGGSETVNLDDMEGLNNVFASEPDCSDSTLSVGALSETAQVALAFSTSFDYIDKIMTSLE